MRLLLDDDLSMAEQVNGSQEENVERWRLVTIVYFLHEESNINLR